MSDYVVGRNYRRREALLGLSLTLPALLIFAVFSFYPLIKTFILTLYRSGDYVGIPNKFVGLSQLTSAWSSSVFLQSLRSTAIYVIIVVPLGVLGGLFLAILAHRKVRGLAIFRTAYASTITSSVAVGAAVFGLFLNPSYGFLPWLGIHIIPQVINNPTWALPAMALIQVWTFMGTSFIILMAGMQSLPDEVLEAAEIDGASSWRRLWRVTVPLLSTSIYITIVVATVGALQGFGQIDVLIGPAGSAYVHTNVLVYLIYQSITYNPNYGLAACYAIALFFITLVFTLIQLRLRQRNSYVEP